jgi:hypothetical protein
VGWEPGSGTVIGNGWGGFKHVVPWAGTSDSDIGLLAVTPTGDVLWYYFYHGWFPNSGNVIASGWGDFVRLVGAFPRSSLSPTTGIYAGTTTAVWVSSTRPELWAGSRIRAT